MLPARASAPAMRASYEIVEHYPFTPLPVIAIARRGESAREYLLVQLADVSGPERVPLAWPLFRASDGQVRYFNDRSDTVCPAVLRPEHGTWCDNCVSDDCAHARLSGALSVARAAEVRDLLRPQRLDPVELPFGVLRFEPGAHAIPLVSDILLGPRRVLRAAHSGMSARGDGLVAAPTIVYELVGRRCAHCGHDGCAGYVRAQATARRCGDALAIWLRRREPRIVRTSAAVSAVYALPARVRIRGVEEGCELVLRFPHVDGVVVRAPRYELWLSGAGERSELLHADLAGPCLDCGGHCLHRELFEIAWGGCPRDRLDSSAVWPAHQA